MSEFKHTRGPWTIDSATRPAEVCVIHHTSHPNGFVYVRGEIGYWGADADENMANARLIAAAPELLEQLLKITNSIPRVLRDEGLLIDAIETIAKATGE